MRIATTLLPSVLWRGNTVACSDIAQRRVIAVYQSNLCHHGANQHLQRRGMHTSQPKEQEAALQTPIRSTGQSPIRPTTAERASMPGLSTLPISQILRTYFITSISSSPRLLAASTTLLRQILESGSPFFRIDKNPLMRALLWQTFYLQFCAGETEGQVARSCSHLRSQGYAGVILEYALEVLKDAEGNEEEDVAVWRQGLLETVRMARPGDFVGLKWSGMGPAAMRRMAKEEEPTEGMKEAMNTLCSAAKEKGISLLPAAEETWSLQGFNDWTLKMQKAFNREGESVVYCTYQAYLKQTPNNLAEHLALANREGFALGIKMVRGAYLSSDDRDKIHDTVQDTHNAYDGIASALVQRKYNDILKAAGGETAESLQNINVVLATHNAVSIRKAQALRQQQAAHNEPLTPLTFAQLQGMADEVSIGLISAAKARPDDENAVCEKVFKCTTWGPMNDCLLYLLRRAAENKDAAGRTRETRGAMGAEIWRRIKAVVRLA